MRLITIAVFLAVAAGVVAAPHAPAVSRQGTGSQQPAAAPDGALVDEVLRSMWAAESAEDLTEPWIRFLSNEREAALRDIAEREAATDDVDAAFQEEELESILEEIDPPRVIAEGVTPSGDGVPEPRTLWSLLSLPVVVVSAAAQQPRPSLQMLVTSLGVSTGDAFSVQFVNHGSTPVRLPRSSLTLRPLKKDAAARVMRDFKQQTGRLTTLTMFGYCLNYRKLAPRAGMVYEVAPRSIQEANLPMREALRSATVLNARGLITPEGDPRRYLHSIRQWAVWTREQRFTEQSFTTAMLDHARQNLSDARRPWSKDVEAALRNSAARRWRDVNTVLGLADKVAARRRQP